MAINYDVDGSSYSSINAACTAIEASHDYSTDGIANVNVSITSADTTPATVDGASAGTPSASAYIKIEGTSGAYHAGKYQTGKQRLECSSGGHCITVSENFVHLKRLAIKQASSTTSAECVRVTAGVANVILEKAILVTNNTTNQDGIYAGNWNVSDISVFDTVIKCGGANSRAGINAQNYGGTSKVQTWHVEHVTIDESGSDDTNAGGVFNRAEVGDSTTINVYNTVAFAPGATSDDYRETGAGTKVWSGQGNTAQDFSCIARLGTTNNQNTQNVVDSDIATTEIFIESLTGDGDYQLKTGISAANNATDNAQSGGVRDSRLDITVDCAGNARPATYTDRDSGAFEIASGSVVTPADATHPHTLDATTLTQHHVLAPAGITHSQLLDIAALTQHHTLAPAEMAHDHLLATSTVTPGALLISPNELLHAHSIDVAAITQHNQITPAELTHSQFLDIAALTQHHQLVPVDIAYAHLVDTGILTQQHQIAPAELTHTHLLAATSIAVAGTVAPADITHAHLFDVSALTQHHALSPAELLQAHSLAAGTVTPGGAISPNELTHAQLLDVAALTQHGILAPIGLTHAHITDMSLLTQLGQLAPADLLQAHLAGASALTQHHALVVDALLHTHSMAESAFTQQHVLVPTGLTQGQIFDAADLTQHYILTPEGLLQPHSVDNGTLLVAGQLVPAGLTHVQLLSELAFLLEESASMSSHVLSIALSKQVTLTKISTQGATLSVTSIKSDQLGILQTHKVTLDL